MALPDALTLQNYTGFRLFARMPKITADPKMWIYYGYGWRVYEGPPDHWRLLSQRGSGMDDIVNVGGAVSLVQGPPDGFEYSVLYRHDREKGGLDGFTRFGFVDPTHHSFGSGGQPFFLKVPANGTNPPINGDFSGIEMDKVVEFYTQSFSETGPNGHEDPEHVITVRWFFAFKVAPSRWKDQ